MDSIGKIDLTAAITDDPQSHPKGGSGAPYIVIYNEQLTDLRLYANAYYESAELLIDTLIDRGTHAGDDKYAFPILYNLVHALELHLKIYLGRLVKHFKKHSCRDLPKPSSDVEKILREHSLRPLFSSIAAMVNHERLHGDKTILKLNAIIEQIQRLGLNAESLRYVEIKGGVKNKLLDKQRWIYLNELKQTFKDAIAVLECAYLSDDFSFCEWHEFKQSRIKEINYSIVLLERIRNESGYQPTDDGDEYWNNIQRVKDYIETLTSRDLLLANRGLRFGKTTPDCVPDIEELKRFWGRDQQIRTLSQQFCLIDKAIEGMNRHRTYIQSRIAVKTP